MKKKRNTIMVLGTGPVIAMSVLLLLLLAFLIYMAFALREREPALSVGCVFFGVISGAVAALLIAACLHHRKEDREISAHWAKLDENPALGDPEEAAIQRKGGTKA